MKLPQQLSAPSRQATLIFVVVMAAYTLSFFQRFAPASIAQDLALSFETSAASLGVLAATYFYVYTLMQVPTGVLDVVAAVSTTSADAPGAKETAAV